MLWQTEASRANGQISSCKGFEGLRRMSTLAKIGSVWRRSTMPATDCKTAMTLSWVAFNTIMISLIIWDSSLSSIVSYELQNVQQREIRGSHSCALKSGRWALDIVSTLMMVLLSKPRCRDVAATGRMEAKLNSDWLRLIMVGSSSAPGAG